MRPQAPLAQGLDHPVPAGRPLPSAVNQHRISHPRSIGHAPIYVSGFRIERTASTRHLHRGPKRHLRCARSDTQTTARRTWASARKPRSRFPTAALCVGSALTGPTGERRLRWGESSCMQRRVTASTLRGAAIAIRCRTPLVDRQLLGALSEATSRQGPDGLRRPRVRPRRRTEPARRTRPLGPSQ